MNDISIEPTYRQYRNKLNQALELVNLTNVNQLAQSLLNTWREQRQFMICGNGGSAGNAIHLANDFLYGVGCGEVSGMKVDALPANSSVISALANDEGYENIFSQQLKVKAKRDDVLIVLSGSGNSQNVVRALEVGINIGMKTHAILGFTGGKCKQLAQYPIHFEIDDMQISEDLQLIVGHICMQWLDDNGKRN